MSRAVPRAIWDFIMITIYGVPVSVHTRKAIVTAALKGLPSELVPVIPFHPPENWSSLSPTGLIPAMTHGDFTLADSTAICHYLERLRPEPSILPKDDKLAARALFFDAYAGGTLYRNVVHGLFVQKVIRPKILNQPTDNSAIEAILANTQPPIFDFLERSVGEAPFGGDELTMADIAVTSNLVNYRYLGFSIDEERCPRLAAYFKRRIALEFFATALRNEKPFAEQMGLDRSFLQ